MEARTILHRLLYEALIDMRVEAYEQRPKPIFHIADLLHNMPLQLEQAAQGECSYDEVLSHLRSRAQEKGPAYTKWLDQTLVQIRRHEHTQQTEESS